MFIPGLQAPVIPLLEVVGNVKLPPLHIAGIGVKVGVTGWLTVTVRVVVVAHCPAAGVKV